MPFDGFHEIASTLGFTEGPQWHEGRLYVTSMSKGSVWVLDPDHPGVVLDEIDTGGGPNGLVLTAGGELFVAQNGAVSRPTRSTRPVRPGIQRIDRDGVVHDELVEGCESPNDLVIGPDGAVWFTDPGPYHVPPLEPSVRRWVPETGELTTVATGFRYPNGLAFSPAGDALIVVDSLEHSLFRFDHADGVLGERTLLVDLLASSPSGAAYPDGIEFDVHGRLWVAALEAGELVVVDEAGEVAHRFNTGEGSRPTNVSFGGADRLTAYATLSKGGRVVAAHLSEMGLA